MRPAHTQALAASSAGSAGSLQLRPGRPSDRGTLWRLILKEKLNPLGLEPGRFTVAERRRGDGSAELVGMGQLKPLSGGAALELASLVVVDEARGQGVGTALVRSLVQQAGGQPIYLTTVSRRAALYQRCGFEEVPPSQVPPFLLFEYLAGLALAWLVTRDRLVLMRRLAAAAAARGEAGGSAAAAAAAGEAGEQQGQG